MEHIIVAKILFGIKFGKFKLKSVTLEYLLVTTGIMTSSKHVTHWTDSLFWNKYYYLMNSEVQNDINHYWFTY